MKQFIERVARLCDDDRWKFARSAQITDTRSIYNGCRQSDYFLLKPPSTRMTLTRRRAQVHSFPQTRSGELLMKSFDANWYNLISWVDDLFKRYGQKKLAWHLRMDENKSKIRGGEVAFGNHSLNKTSNNHRIIVSLLFRQEPKKCLQCPQAYRFYWRSSRDYKRLAWENS